MAGMTTLANERHQRHQRHGRDKTDAYLSLLLYDDKHDGEHDARETHHQFTVIQKTP